jgi:polyisoprenoid-binding protein YceI
MKVKIPLLLSVPPLLAGAYMAFHPGVAYAETPLAKLPPTAFRQAASYTVDPAHTFIGFDIGHLGLSRVQGRFDKLTGTLTANPKDLAQCGVQLSADVSSIDTVIPPRDADLKSDHFFDAAKYPSLTFKSTRIRRKGAGYIADGDLTIKGVSKPVSITFKAYGPIKDPWGGTRIGVVAEPLVIRRSDFGITFDADSISDDVLVRLSLEATQDKAS